jgi:hypothetical protein
MRGLAYSDIWQCENNGASASHFAELMRQIYLQYAASNSFGVFVF